MSQNDTGGGGGSKISQKSVTYYLNGITCLKKTSLRFWTTLLVLGVAVIFFPVSVFQDKEHLYQLSNINIIFSLNMVWLFVQNMKSFFFTRNYFFSCFSHSGFETYTAMLIVANFTFAIFFVFNRNFFNEVKPHFLMSRM